MRVQPGEGFWSIARRLGFTGDVTSQAQALQQANGLPSKLYVGQYLIVPPEVAEQIPDPPPELPPPPPPPPPPAEVEVIDLRDFGAQGAGLRPMSIVGPGSDLRTYRLSQSTRAGQVPAQGSGQTNPFFILHPGRTSSPHVQGLRLEGFEVDGSDVGHNHHGIQVGYVDGLEIVDVRVIGVRGSTSSPPGETFALSVWRTDNATLDGVTLDGRNRAGVKTASTLLGLNNARNVTVTNTVCTGSQSGFGVACWQSGTTGDHVNRFVDVDLRDNRRAINHERCYGRWEYVRPDCRDSHPGEGRPHVTANSDQGSMGLTIIEPLWDRERGPFRVGVNTGRADQGGGDGLYLGSPNLQRVDDITVIIDGRTYRGHTNTNLLKIGSYW